MKHIEMIPGTIATPLPDDDYIAIVEAGLRVKFPADFEEFLKTYGGARPVVGTFMAGNHEWAIDRFLCLLKNFDSHPLGWYDIEATWSQLSTRLCENPDKVGAEMVPAVVLFAGDFVCLDYRHDPDAPSVVVWLHEQSDDFSPVTIPVADTFTDFLNLVT